jgi:hypothetical protein
MFVYTAGLQGGVAEREDPEHFTYFKGAIDNKTWMDDWA